MAGGGNAGEGTQATPVAIAAGEGDLAKLRDLVTSGAAVNVANGEGRTPLHLAATEGRLEVARYLIEEAGAHVNPTDRWGGSPLDDALRSGNKELAKFLELRGGKKGQTNVDYDAGDLGLAAASGDMATMRRLVREHKVDPDEGDYDKRTALHRAAAEGQVEAVTFLVEEMGAELSPLDRWRSSPLDEAVRAGHEVVASYLCGKGASRGAENANADDGSPRGGLLVTQGSLKALEPSAQASRRGSMRRRSTASAANGEDQGGSRMRVGGSLRSSVADFSLFSYRSSVTSLHSTMGIPPPLPGQPLELGDYLIPLPHPPSEDLLHPGRLRIGRSARKMAAEMVDLWTFDVLSLQEASRGHALYLLGLAVFERHNLLKACRIDMRAFERFLLRMEHGYGANPYHNSMHGADVLMTTHLFLSKYGFLERLSSLELLASLLGALMHDFNHPGTTNAHEAKLHSARAIIYSDSSILERHHLASSFELLRLLKAEGHDLLGGLPAADYQTVRSLIIDIVLHTDLSNHFKFVSRLQALCTAKGHSQSSNTADAAGATSAGSSGGAAGSGGGGGGSGGTSEAESSSWVSTLHDPESVDVRLLLGLAIKFADLGHSIKPFHLHKAWTVRVTNEFWALGDRERALGVPISPLCDREAEGSAMALAKSQVGFFSYVCTPFYAAIADLVDPHMEPYAQLLANQNEWAVRVERANKLEPKLEQDGRTTRRRLSSQDGGEDVDEAEDEAVDAAALLRRLSTRYDPSDSERSDNEEFGRLSERSEEVRTQASEWHKGDANGRTAKAKKDVKEEAEGAVTSAPPAPVAVVKPSGGLLSRLAHKLGC